MRLSKRSSGRALAIDVKPLFYIKLFLVPLLLLTLLISSGRSASLIDSQRYQENQQLNGLLVGEQFQLGLSCDQAVEKYGLDLVRSVGTSDSIITATGMGFDKDQQVEPGFFRARCDDGQLRYVDKFISVQDGILDRDQILDAFIGKYGKPSAGGDNANYLRYYIIYEGKYANFKLTLRQVDNRTIMIYELEDETADVQM